MSFGRYGGFPFRFGAAKKAHRAAHVGLLDALSPAFSTDENTANFAECYAMARVVSIIWACNERAGNQGNPNTMLEELPVWEEACDTRPSPQDRAVDRRAVLAGKMRGLSSNSFADVYGACQAVFGDNFEDLVHIDPANSIRYWPGIYPGPPGFEWSSNHMIVGVKVSTNGLSTSDFIEKRDRLASALDALLPVYAMFQIGVGNSFVVNQGVVAQTFI